jgi:hypothetical protein
MRAASETVSDVINNYKGNSHRNQANSTKKGNQFIKTISVYQYQNSREFYAEPNGNGYKYHIHIYIPLTLYPRRDNRGISNIPCFTKIVTPKNRDTHVLPKLVSYEEHCRRDMW